MALPFPVFYLIFSRIKIPAFNEKFPPSPQRNSRMGSIVVPCGQTATLKNTITNNLTVRIKIYENQRQKEENINARAAYGQTGCGQLSLTVRCTGNQLTGSKTSE
ncbi:hypothetical protein TNCV_4950481 [Trichonephila clavipes]|nr:hypothetical protein TNCV_4950481 [Trichonephila clavipes]